MTVAGLIFSNIHDQCIPEMTQRRTMASIPFGCRYRLVDFPLSNMVHAGITNVGIITHYNYQSLMDHLGTGKDWDLARRNGGIKILPPYVTAFENRAAGKLYENRLEALMGSANFINRCNADYLVLSDCDVLMNIDLREVVEDHVASGAYITLVTKKIDASKHPLDTVVHVLTLDGDRRVTDLETFCPESGTVQVCTNLMVISRSDLLSIISEADARGYHSFAQDIVVRQLRRKLIRAYEYDGWYAHLSSLENYFRNSMLLLGEEARNGLFRCEGRQILTKIRNSGPSRYTPGAVVRNSMIADGCTVEGTVENCILFRGVHIGKGTVAKNCILLQDTYVGSDVSLNCVVTDKNVVIKDGRNLSGHETMPFFIGKGAMV